LFDDEPIRKAVPYLNDGNPAVAEPSKILKQLNYGRPQQEIVLVQLRPGTIFGTKLDLLGDAGWGIEDRVANSYLQILDSTKIVALHQLQQLPTSRG